MKNIEKHDFKIFDAHMHSYGIFLNHGEDVISYMDRFNVEKAIVTTINKGVSLKKLTKDDEAQNPEKNESGSISKVWETFKYAMPKGQLSHQDVIDLAKKAPERIYKFFWFNPKLKSEEEEENYKVLENHFKLGFRGVKIHSAFHLVRVPKDILKLASFMQDYDKKFVLFIHSLPKTIFFGGISAQDIAKLADQFPSLRIIVGHAAYCMEYSLEVAMTLRKYKNIYFETSCSVSYGIFNLIKSMGHERILFGSDSPVASQLPIEIEKIQTLPISEEQKRDILYNNVNGLLLK